MARPKLSVLPPRDAPSNKCQPIAAAAAALADPPLPRAPPHPAPPTHHNASQATDEPGHGTQGFEPVRQDIPFSSLNSHIAQTDVQLALANSRGRPNTRGSGYYRSPALLNTNKAIFSASTQEANIEAPSDLTYTLGSDSHVPADNPEADDHIDPFKIYELGRALCTIACNMIAEMGASQTHILDSLPVPSETPRPLLRQPSAQELRGRSPQVPRHQSPIPNHQPQPPTHSYPSLLQPCNGNPGEPPFAAEHNNQPNQGGGTFSSPFPGGLETYSSSPGPPPPSDSSLDWHEINPQFDYYPVMSTLDFSNTSTLPVPGTFQAGGSNVITAPAGGASAQNSSSKVCQQCEPVRVFRRIGDLLDHMHVHTKEKPPT
ncbi:hypothetical protein RSOLAG1IB_06458 [Rhizoctonia solani AG-1 IB]|uniref:C2H2-type domain-containing protein n=1 Tax=Thanatephorus cucumeris (strain AG1-IB / isolate 7/3/14) TaxID=1108050 RepID=A0A0B7FBQ4_THACB|nr:hypothetical protein RSOLAG1IB_06458 [Rhizoctonia solani AG-1 IB]